jgi:hypothetical protein
MLRRGATDARGAKQGNEGRFQYPGAGNLEQEQAGNTEQLWMLDI